MSSHDEWHCLYEMRLIRFIIDRPFNENGFRRIVALTVLLTLVQIIEINT